MNIYSPFEILVSLIKTRVFPKQNIEAFDKQRWFTKHIFYQTPVTNTLSSWNTFFKSFTVKEFILIFAAILYELMFYFLLSSIESSEDF